MGRARAAVVHFWRKAYEDNLTGLASMVAYNLLLSIFPLALVALWIAGRVLRSNELQNSVLLDLQQLFPSAAESTLEHRDPAAAGDVDDRRHPRARRRGLVRVLVLGRARHRVLPHLPPRLPHAGCARSCSRSGCSPSCCCSSSPPCRCRRRRACSPAARTTSRSGSPTCAGWSTASRSPPASSCCSSRCAPPTRWSRAGGCRGAACGRAPLGATLAIGVARLRASRSTCTNVSTLRVGTTFVFVLIALVWFYALSIIVLAGAVVNELRFERRASLTRSVGDRDGGADEALRIRDRGRRSVVLGPGRGGDRLPRARTARARRRRCG